jgi:hypothetical protein
MASLIARLGLDQTAFQSGLDKAKASTRNFANQGLGSVKTALAGAFSVAVVERFASEALNLAEHLTDLSKRTGINVETLQRLGHAAERSGSNLDGVTAGITKLSVSMADALGDNEAARNSFANLGVSLEDLKSLSPEEVFMRLADAVKNSNDPVQVAGDLNNVLGRSFKELIPLLLEGREGIEGLKAQAIGVIPEETIARIDTFKDQLEDAWGLTKLLGAEVVIFASNVQAAFEVGVQHVRKFVAELMGDVAAIKSAEMELEAIGKRNLGLKDEDPKKIKAQKITRVAEITTSAKKEDSAEDQRQKRVAELRKQILEAETNIKRSQLSIEDQLLDIQREKDALQQDLDSGNSEERELELKREILKVDQELLQVQKKQTEENLKKAQDFAKEVKERQDILDHIAELKEGKGTGVSGPISDSISRIGGFVGGSSNNALRIAERQQKIQEDIKNYLKEINSKINRYGDNDQDAIFGP